VAKYLVLWKANAANWPVDPKQALAVLEMATGGGDALLGAGGLKELGWFTTEEGFGIFEAESKDKVLAMVQPFFPYFSQDIREIVSWDAGKQAILGSARQNAAR
jgi:hypothetical protein